MRLFPLVDGSWNRFDRGGTLTRPFDINLLRQRGGSSVSRRVGKASRVHRRESNQDEVDVESFIDDSIDDRLTTSDQDLFSPAYASGQTNTWNTSRWIVDFDFSGLSMSNDEDATMAGTLISPRHVLFSHHHSPTAGAVMSFVKADGTEYNTTLDAITQVAEGGTTDFAVGYLDADVPAGITWYKILPSNISLYVAYVGRPVILCDAERQVLVGDINSLAVSVEVKNAEGDLLDTAVVMDIRQGSGDRASYWEGPVTGDSGHPTFTAIGDELVLKGLHYGTNGVTADRFYDLRPRAWVEGINSAMDDVDADSTGYRLTRFDITETGYLRGSKVKRGVGKTSDPIRRTP